MLFMFFSPLGWISVESRTENWFHFVTRKGLDQRRAYNTQVNTLLSLKVGFGSVCVCVPQMKLISIPSYCIRSFQSCPAHILIARGCLLQKHLSKEIQGREEATMNPKDNDSTEIYLLGKLKYRPSAEVSGKVFLSPIKSMKSFKFLLELLWNKRKGKSKREILSPRLKLSEWKLREEIKEKILCDKIIWLTSFNKLPPEILLGRVKAPLSSTFPLTHPKICCERKHQYFSPNL